MGDPNAEMHRRSGTVHDADPLVALFYDLLRDHIQPGDLEKLVRTACEHSDKTMVYSNGWLAEYARDMVKRLDNARNPSAQTTSVLTK
jgi:hypothetical protein